MFLIGDASKAWLRIGPNCPNLLSFLHSSDFHLNVFTSCLQGDPEGSVFFCSWWPRSRGTSQELKPRATQRQRETRSEPEPFLGEQRLAEIDLADMLPGVLTCSTVMEEEPRAEMVGGSKNKQITAEVWTQRLIGTNDKRVYPDHHYLTRSTHTHIKGQCSCVCVHVVVCVWTHRHTIWLICVTGSQGQEMRNGFF